MIKLTDNGYVYVSRSGITYDLLNGETIGNFPSKSSDIVFIMLTDDSYNVDNNVVGYFYGAYELLRLKDDFEESIITKIVDEFEKRNNLKELNHANEITREIVCDFNTMLR